MSDSDLDRQVREADLKMGNYGLTYAYRKRFSGESFKDESKIDCILFANNEHCAAMLNKYAEDKFHALDDKYRVYLASKSESCQSQYNEIKRDGKCVSSHLFRLPEYYRAKKDENGRNFTNHLFINDNGTARISLNGWEEKLIDEEAGHERFLRLDMLKGAVRYKVLSAVNNDELDYIFTGSGEFMCM